MKHIGIPRALFHHYLGAYWQDLLHALGHEVVVSPPTSRAMLDRGVVLTVAEACLPVKVCFGHADWLVRRGVDRLFVPRLVSVARKTFICPKLMGLPDMIRAAFPAGPPVLDATLDLHLEGAREEAWVSELAQALGADRRRALPALRLAREAQAARLSAPRQAPGAGLRLALLGHAYLTGDAFVNLGLREKLASLGVEALTAEDLDEAAVLAAAGQLEKRLFWSLGQKIIGGALHAIGREDIHGLIHVTAFGCGPDSLVGDLAERYARRAGKPFLLITLDEHSGAAGLSTRLEAFIDLLERRRTA